MPKKEILIGMLLDDSETFSYIEVCQKYHMPKELLTEMMEEGLFEKSSADIEHLQLSRKELQKIESAFRLHHDLGINLPGVTLALELIDKIESMKKELNVLKKHFQ